MHNGIKSQIYVIIKSPFRCIFRARQRLSWMKQWLPIESFPKQYRQYHPFAIDVKRMQSFIQVCPKQYTSADLIDLIRKIEREKEKEMKYTQLSLPICTCTTHGFFSSVPFFFHRILNYSHISDTIATKIYQRS